MYIRQGKIYKLSIFPFKACLYIIIISLVLAYMGSFYVLRTHGSVGKYLFKDKCYFYLFAEKVFKIIFSCNSRLIMLSYFIVLTWSTLRVKIPGISQPSHATLRSYIYIHVIIIWILRIFLKEIKHWTFLSFYQWLSPSWVRTVWYHKLTPPPPFMRSSFSDVRDIIQTAHHLCLTIKSNISVFGACIVSLFFVCSQNILIDHGRIILIYGIMQFEPKTDALIPMIITQRYIYIW